MESGCAIEPGQRLVGDPLTGLPRAGVRLGNDIVGEVRSDSTHGIPAHGDVGLPEDPLEPHAITLHHRHTLCARHGRERYGVDLTQSTSLSLPSVEHARTPTS